MCLNRKIGYAPAHWLLFGLFFATLPALGLAPKRDMYQLTVYHVADNTQRAHLETYLQQAYLPALHRAGLKKIGVFKPADADSMLYLLIPLQSVDQFMSLPKTLENDRQYVSAAQTYRDAEYNSPNYKRFEVILMEAFAGMPVLNVPTLQAAPTERIYELRSYEAATEKLHENKIAMFNNGELDIFRRLGFNLVFGAQVRAGGKMPNLMYMTAFENKAARDAHWKQFGDDAGWKTMNASSEYAHNFLRADIHLLHPTPYSEI